MVSKQFSRKYNLPDEAKLAEVESNLSQDGVLVVTIPKEKRIEEIKESEKSKDSQELRVRKKSTEKEMEKSSKSLIPMRMRDSFFDDPFFKDSWFDMETSQKNFFEESRKQFEESWKNMQSEVGRDSKISKMTFDEPDSVFKAKDSAVINLIDDDSKLEVSLDTAGYKPDELKVTAG